MAQVSGGPLYGSKIKGKQTDGESLMKELRRLDKKRNKVLAEIKRQMIQSIQPTPERELIAFVDTIETAHEYFDFRDYLKANYGYDKDDGKSDYYPKLVYLPRQLSMFQKLLESDICGAVRAHTIEEGFKVIRSPRYQQLLLEKGKCPDLTFLDLPETEIKDSYALSNPVFGMVLQSREYDYDMHLDPKEELRVIKSRPNYCGNYIFREPAEECLEKNVRAIENVNEALEKYSKLRNYSKKRSAYAEIPVTSIDGGMSHKNVTEVTDVIDIAAQDGGVPNEKAQLNKTTEALKRSKHRRNSKRRSRKQSKAVEDATDAKIDLNAEFTGLVI